MNKLIIGILFVVVGVSLGQFPPSWRYDYYATSLRVGTSFKGSPQTAGYAYIENLTATTSTFTNAGFTNLAGDSIDVDHIKLDVNLLGVSAYVDVDSLQSDHITGTNMVISGYFSSDSVESDHGLFGVNISSPKFASPSATSYQYFASSAVADTLGFRLTGVSGDRDIVLKMVEEDGTVHTWSWDDALGVRYFDAEVYSAGRLTVGAGVGQLAAVNATDLRVISLTDDLILASVDDVEIDPNTSGGGLIKLGETGDLDLTNMNSQMYHTPMTIADGDATPSVAGGNVFTTSANTGATEITDLDNPIAGQIVYLVGGSNTNSSTITDGGNFYLTGNWTAAVDATLTLLVRADNNYLELTRSAN